MPNDSSAHSTDRNIVGETDNDRRLQPEDWLDAHGDVLYRYALAQTRRPEVAQDVVQETLLAAWRGRREFGADSSERTWLLGICRHKTLDYFRRSARREHRATAYEAEQASEEEFFTTRGRWQSPPGAWSRDPLGEAEADGFWTVLLGCVSQLPASQRECFELRELSEMESAEASQTLGVSVNYLYVLLHRARLRLRRCLREHWFGGGGAS